MASVKNLTFKEVLELVRPDLLRVEEEFGIQTTTGVRPITEIGQYLQEGGGKRLRPALVLLAAKLCGYEGMAAVRMGAVVEMIHTATLVHDDVIDEADTRRGRPSTNSRWGNPMSVLAGDWLYMQAFNIALNERNFRILDVLIRLTQVMVEGELLQLTCLRKPYCFRRRIPGTGLSQDRLLVFRVPAVRGAAGRKERRRGNAIGPVRH